MRLCTAPLESLGVVQLVERFALALAARRAAQTAPALQPAAPFAEPLAPGEIRRQPVIGRPFDSPDDSGPASDPASELVRWTLPEPEGEGESIDEDLIPDPAAAEPYTSLLDMRPATRVPAPLADFVRIEDQSGAPLAESGPQPVVVFPGQAVPAPPVATHLPGLDGPATPVQTEQALREALAALQRMSGAA